MIKASEMRIGNWISEYNEYRQWNQYDFTLNPSFYNPIPLTPELLIACGFKEDNNHNYWIQTEGLLHYLELIPSQGLFYPVYAEVPEFSSQDEQRVSLNYIQYLHQLQNLYFALTNSELTIKL